MQLNNMLNNTPGINQKIDIDREQYEEFRVNLGIQKPEESSLIFSPQAEYRRKQIRDFKATGKENPTIAQDPSMVNSYAQQVNRNMN